MKHREQEATTRRRLFGLVATVMLGALLGLAACSSSPDAGSSSTSDATAPGDGVTLQVSAAASLKNAFTDIGRGFDQANGSMTSFNFDASGTLQKQIEAGASVDVFASAAQKQMNALVDAKLIDATTVKNFAGNSIVLVVPAGSTLGLASFKDLTKDTVKRIAYGDPAAAPHGVAAEEILRSLDIVDQVRPKVIYAANVTQTLAYVAGGEVDAAIMFATEAAAGGDRVKIVATADQSWYTRVVYPIGVVSASEHQALARMFVDYVMAPEGQAILAKYGFLPAP